MRFWTIDEWITFVNDYSIFIAIAVIIALMIPVWMVIKRARSRWARDRTADSRDIAILRALMASIALIAMFQSATGMLRFFAEKLNQHGVNQWAGFFIFEFAMLGSGIYARFRRRHRGSAGFAGKAVWGFAAATGFFASLDAHNGAEALWRYVPPLIGAFFFELMLNVEDVIRAAADLADNPDAEVKPKRVWVMSLERILIRWGWVEPDGRDSAAYARQRLLAKLARVNAAYWHRYKIKPDTWRTRKLGEKADALFELANERLGFATNPAVRDEYLDMLAVIYNGRSGSSPSALAARDPFAFTPPAPRPPAPPARQPARQEVRLPKASALTRKAAPTSPAAAGAGTSSDSLPDRIIAAKRFISDWATREEPIGPTAVSHALREAHEIGALTRPSAGKEIVNTIVKTLNAERDQARFSSGEFPKVNVREVATVS